MDLDALVTASEAAAGLRESKQLVSTWVKLDKLTPVSRRGRSPLYRWRDVLAVEAAMRNSPYSSRNPKHNDRQAA